MANTAGICVSFKEEVLQGIHAIGLASGGNTPARATAGVSDTIKGALFLVSGALAPATTTAYATTNELTNGAGTGYTAGGQTVAFPTPVNNSTSGCATPSASLVWTALTSSAAFDTLMLYNSSQGNRAIALYNFGSQTITAGTLTLTMPANTLGNALIELQ